MIGPFTRFADMIAAGGDRRTVVGVPSQAAQLPSQASINQHAEMYGRDVGVIFQPGEAHGRHLVVEREGAPPLLLERTTFYALAKVDEVYTAARAIVDEALRMFGPGRAWTLAGRVHVVCDDGAVVRAPYRRRGTLPCALVHLPRERAARAGERSMTRAFHIGRSYKPTTPDGSYAPTVRGNKLSRRMLRLGAARYVSRIEQAIAKARSMRLSMRDLASNSHEAKRLIAADRLERAKAP